MVEFIFTLILMVSLSFVLYLMVRALPRMEEEPAMDMKKSFLDRWANSHIPEKIDLAFNGFMLKFLRKAKVSILKLDNTLGKHLQKIKNQEGADKIDFKDIVGQDKEGKSE